MSVIILLTAVSLFVAGGFLLSFIWSVKSGQYEDVYTPSVRIILDQEPDKVLEEETEIKSANQTTN